MDYKKYILLAGDKAIPQYGLLSIKGYFDTVQDARDHFYLSQESYKSNWDWYQIADRLTWQVIEAMDAGGAG